MLHTTSPGSKPGRRTSSGAATALSARNISGASISGNRANGHSRAASDSRDLLHHIHKTPGSDSPSLSALSPSPPPSYHPPKKPSSLPDSSNTQPGGFDTLSIDSASVASADSGGQPRVRRLCSPENSRRPFVPPPCRQSTYPRSSSQSKDLGGAYTGRLTEQALRDQEAVQRSDLDDPVPKTHAAPYQTINSTPQKFTSQSFREDTIMTSSTPEEYGGSVRTSRDRSRSLASTYSDPIRKTDDGAEAIVQGTMSGTLGSRPERSLLRHKYSASGSMDMGFSNYGDNKDGKFSQPTVEGSREKVRSTEGNGDSVLGNRPILASATSSQVLPFRNTTIRAEEKARSAQEQSDNHGKQHLGSPSNASRHGSSVGTAAGPISALRSSPRANSSPKDSKAPRQAASALSSPSPDQQFSRRDKGHISKPDVSPIAAKQQSQKPSHKRNATTSSISRTFSSERGVGKARDERNRSSSAASVRGTTARGKPTSRPVSTTSAMEVEGSLEVAPSEALATDANPKQPIPVETLGAARMESRTSRSSSTSDWRTSDSDTGADFSSRKRARDKKRNSRVSSTNESTLNANNYKDLNFEAYAQESSPQSFLKRPSEDDYEDLAPASRAGNMQTSRYTPTPSPSKRRDTRRKNATVPQGLQEFKPARKSPLEEEDSDVDSLQYLLDNDRDFSALFSPVDDEEEDDTALLLAGLPTHKPPAAQKLKVRPRVEAEAGDHMWEQERAVQEKLMNRLRTLQLEVRSANRGLEVLESHLDGTGSSGDISECWDDATQRKEYMRGLRKEQQKQRLILERRMRQKVALLGTPLPWSKWLVKWGFIAFLVVIVWYLLELAVFLHSMPPSYSSVAIERKPPPEFGALFSHAILRPAKFIFNGSAWMIQHGSVAAMNLTSAFFLTIIGSCKAIFLKTLSYSWRVTTTGMPQAVGSDQVIDE